MTDITVGMHVEYGFVNFFDNEVPKMRRGRSGLFCPCNNVVRSYYSIKYYLPFPYVNLIYSILYFFLNRNTR